MKELFTYTYSESLAIAPGIEFKGETHPEFIIGTTTEESARVALSVIRINDAITLEYRAGVTGVMTIDDHSLNHVAIEYRLHGVQIVRTYHLNHKGN